jgi:hypothetical protein
LYGLLPIKSGLKKGNSLPKFFLENMLRERSVKFEWDTSDDGLCHYVRDENIDIIKTNVELVVSRKKSGLEESAG